MAISTISAMSIICMHMALNGPMSAAAVSGVSAAALAASTVLDEPAVAASQDDRAGPAEIARDIAADTASAPSAAPAPSVEQPVAAPAPLPAPAELEAAPIGIDDPRPLIWANEDDAAIVERLVGYLEGFKTLRGDFTQIAPSGAQTTGDFSLRRPGLLRFEYDEDTSPLLVIANGGLVYVHDKDLETTDSYPVGQTPLKFLLRKKVDLETAEVRAVDRGIDTIAVTFASTDEETEGEITLIAEAPTLKLRQWLVRDLQNGLTIVTLNNVEHDVKLSNRLFRVPEADSPFLKN